MANKDENEEVSKQQYLEVSMYPIIDGIPFYDRLLDAYCCVGKPPEGFTGFTFDKEQVEALRNVAKLASVFEIDKGQIGLFKEGKAVRVDGWSTFISEVVMKHESLKEIFRKVGIRGPLFVDTVIIYKDDAGTDAVSALADKMHEKNGIYPYITFFNKTDNKDSNFSLLEYELAVLNPTTLFCFFAPTDVPQQVRDMFEHFKVNYKEK